VLAPRGLSSLLLDSAVGTPGKIYGEEESFAIERELGAGQFGKVVQVRQVSHDLVQAPRRYAIKLHRGSINEARILASINHPFCVLLRCYFEMSSERTFVYEDGSRVGRFKMGIMMELCSSGTLQDLLATCWCEHGSAHPRAALQHDGPLKTACLERLVLWRRLAAELADVLACLHGHKPPIVYRDLKPDNVLMRLGHDQQLHACLTDFGYAKQPSFGDELESVAGNWLTVAPEVPRPWEQPRPYTQFVDNWSLGLTLLCMLWCTYRTRDDDKIPTVQEAELWEDEGDPRIPPCAARLIKTLTQVNPMERGTMREASEDCFFTASFMHLGKEFEPVQIQALLDAAKR